MRSAKVWDLGTNKHQAAFATSSDEMEIGFQALYKLKAVFGEKRVAFSPIGVNIKVKIHEAGICSWYFPIFHTVHLTAAANSCCNAVLGDKGNVIVCLCMIKTTIAFNNILGLASSVD